MHQNIIAYISQFVSLSPEEEDFLVGQNLFKEYKKNQIILAEGDLARECFFVIKGCVRAYYLKDGEEKNTHFYFENQSIRPLAYHSKQPSTSFLACLEDSMLALGSEERNKLLIERIPKLAGLVMQLNEQLLLQQTEEFDFFKGHSPEERYLHLLQEKPEWLSRIPLYHLASYLGITQISLSRIRSRLAQQKRD